MWKICDQNKKPIFFKFSIEYERCIHLSTSFCMAKKEFNRFPEIWQETFLNNNIFIHNNF